MWGNPTFIPKWKSSDAAIANTHKCDCQERDRLVFPKFDSAHNLVAEIGVQSTPDQMHCIGSCMVPNHVHAVV